MLSYLEESAQPEISIFVTQCTFFCNNPSLVNERAVKRISKYLEVTSTYVDLPDGNPQLSTCDVV